MAKSSYKGAALGKTPPCLLCGGPGDGERRRVLLGNGVGVWLCGAHRSDGFWRRRGGRDLVTSLMHAWRAAGCLDRRRERALESLLLRIRDGGPRPDGRPGSYAWPGLRRETERMVGQGRPAASIVRDIRSRVREGVAGRAPSESTVRRWVR